MFVYRIVQFALVYKKLCLTVTPEYYVPVAKSDGMKELVKVSDAYDKALKASTFKSEFL